MVLLMVPRCGTAPRAVDMVRVAAVPVLLPRAVVRVVGALVLGSGMLRALVIVIVSVGWFRALIIVMMGVGWFRALIMGAGWFRAVMIVMIARVIHRRRLMGRRFLILGCRFPVFVRNVALTDRLIAMRVARGIMRRIGMIVRFRLWTLHSSSRVNCAARREIQLK